MIKKVIVCLLIVSSFSSCVAVKEHEKINLNDPDMKLSSSLVKRFETNFQVYREGASGAMVEKQEEAVVAISMKKIFCIIVFSCFGLLNAQTNNSQNTSYKKKVLETAEVDLLMSYYTQDGNHASVTGGIGNEKLTDVTPTIVFSIPLNFDDVLTIDAGISAYTSASSSNLDPFDASGASGGDDDDDDDDDDNNRQYLAGEATGSPWVESSGASQKDVWTSVNASYSHSSDDRNNIWSANFGFASEYDYSSIGVGGGFVKLFNEKIQK